MVTENLLITRIRAAVELIKVRAESGVDWDVASLSTVRAALAFLQSQFDDEGNRLVLMPDHLRECANVPLIHYSLGKSTACGLNRVGAICTGDRVGTAEATCPECRYTMIAVVRPNIATLRGDL